MAFAECFGSSTSATRPRAEQLRQKNSVLSSTMLNRFTVSFLTPLIRRLYKSAIMILRLRKLYERFVKKDNSTTNTENVNIDDSAIVPVAGFFGTKVKLPTYQEIEQRSRLTTKVKYVSLSFSDVLSTIREEADLRSDRRRQDGRSHQARAARTRDPGSQVGPATASDCARTSPCTRSATT